jgi:hypothetical protein
MLLQNLQVTEQYITVCAHNEHFMVYREIVRQQIEAQLTTFKQQASIHV